MNKKILNKEGGHRKKFTFLVLFFSFFSFYPPHPPSDCVHNDAIYDSLVEASGLNQDLIRLGCLLNTQVEIPIYLMLVENSGERTITETEI